MITYTKTEVRFLTFIRIYKFNDIYLELKTNKKIRRNIKLPFTNARSK